MAKASQIRNLDQLEKDIFRLKLEARQSEGRMNDHIDKLQTQFGSMLRNTVFPKKETAASAASGVVNSLLEHYGLRHSVSRLLNKLADKAAEGLDGLVERVFRKE